MRCLLLSFLPEGDFFFFLKAVVGLETTRSTTKLHRAHKEFRGRNRTGDTSAQKEEEKPAHPKEEEDASVQHVESGWTLVSDRRRREWVSTHPAGGW